MLVFYPCRIAETENYGGINLVGIAAISFIPIGYCLSVLAQLLYLIIPRLGIVGSAIRQSKIFTDDSRNNLRREHLAEVDSLFYVIENNPKGRVPRACPWVSTRGILQDEY